MVRKKVNRNTKVVVGFDAAARSEFLTGFRKRKLQRKKVASERLLVKSLVAKKKVKKEPNPTVGSICPLWGGLPPLPACSSLRHSSLFPKIEHLS